MNDPDKPPHVDVTLVSFRGLTNGDTHFTFSVLEKDRRIALELFSEIGATGFLVRIKPDAARNKMIRDAGAPQKKRTGLLSVECALWCKNPEFWEFLNKQDSLNYLFYLDDEALIDCEEWASLFVKKYLGIESRSELDSEGEARDRYIEHFQSPYRKHKNRE